MSLVKFGDSENQASPVRRMSLCGKAGMQASILCRSAADDTHTQEAHAPIGHTEADLVRKVA